MRMGRLLAAVVTASLVFVLACSNSGYELPSNVVVVYGDSRTGHAVHQSIVDSIMKTEPVAVFHTGDLVADGGSRADWAKFNEIAATLVENTQFYPSLGNHDLPPQLFLENFDLPNNERWYSVEVNDIHFVVLDSNSDTSEGSEQYQWLEAELRGIGDRAEFAVAVFHHPPFSTGAHAEDEKGLRRTLVRLFEQYGVCMVFSGHDHDYERSVVNGIHYVVTGGGGAPLRGQARTDPRSRLFVKTYHFCTLSIEDNQLTVSAFDADLRLIDQFTVVAGEPPGAASERSCLELAQLPFSLSRVR